MASVLIAATSDLFLQSRISEVAKSRGFDARFVKDERELIEAARTVGPRLVVLDLSADEYDAFSCARTLRALFPLLGILGFFPHVRTELRTRAKDSGIDYIVPNSSLLKNLKSVLSSGKVAG